MRRGDVCTVALDPAVGSEAAKTRPAVVVSNDGANIAASRVGRGVVTVVPLTTNVTRVHAFQVLIPAAASGLPRDSKVRAEQVRSVSITRIGPVIATLPLALLDQVDAALRTHLSL